MAVIFGYVENSTASKKQKRQVRAVKQIFIAMVEKVKLNRKLSEAEVKKIKA